MERPKAILIAGPTASGKSALALRLARAFDGAVINADSMQVYAGLRILSARPSREEMGGVEHHLYGHVDPAAAYSAGHWLREMESRLAATSAGGTLPIVCGGTGLYFRALLGGFDDLPAVPAAIRARWRARGASEPPEHLHRELAARDPDAARTIRPTDPIRIVRALELLEATGRPLADLRRNAGQPLLTPEGVMKLVLAPDRAVLRARIADRFDAMLAAGALEEALAFRARGPEAQGGLAAQAIGLRELLDHADGALSLAAARERAITRTRQYAKRQDTWFRNQFGPDWRRLSVAADFNLCD